VPFSLNIALGATEIKAIVCRTPWLAWKDSKDEKSAFKPNTCAEQFMTQPKNNEQTNQAMVQSKFRLLHPACTVSDCGERRCVDHPKGRTWF
jgi:hypothetical protein